MADLFDALAARALGVAPVLSPAVQPRFAEPAEEPAQGELIGTAETTASGRDAFPPAAAAPTAAAGLKPEPSRLDAPASPAVPAAQPSRRPVPGPAAAGEPPVSTKTPLQVEPGVVVETVARSAESVSGPAEPSHTEETAASSPAFWSEQDAVSDAPAPAQVAGSGPLSEPPSLETSRAAIEQLRVLLAPADPGADRPPASSAAPSGGDQEPGPRITVTIGHVEVRAPAQATPPPAQRPRWPEPRLSLQDYLRQASRR